MFNAKVAKHKTSVAIVFNSMIGINIGNTELKVSANNKILLLALTFNSVLPILMPIIELKTIATLVLCLATFALNNLLLLLRQFITSL